MMNLLNEYELALGLLPNESDSNQVIYIENHKNIKLEWFIKGNLYELKKLFSKRGLEFIYLPELIDCIDDEALIEAARYYIPWLNTTDMQTLREACKISIEQLYNQVNLKDGVPAVVNSKGRAFKVDVSRERDFGILFYQIAEAYARETDQEEQCIMYQTILDEKGWNEASEPGFSYKSENPLDEEYAESDRMYNELKKKLPSWALEAVLSAQLRKEETISRIVIDSPRRLLLPDYNNMEIRLAPATMAFYLLFLKHPEGIRFQELIDYRKELYDIYRFTTKSDNKEAIAHTVDVMVAQIDGNQDIQRSRIKAAINNSFRSYICEDYAKWYYLDGKRAEPMKIAVAGQPGKVIWNL